jgi:hypothetical protein
MRLSAIRELHRLHLALDLALSQQPSHLEIQAAILASRGRYPKLNLLSDADVKVYSQWGEDGILDYLCECLGIERPKIIEVGAGNFTECNSRFLVEFRNASATLVDADANLEKNVKESDLYWKTHLYSITDWISPSNINSIIKRATQQMGGLDIFSLDLDGNDYWILKEANLGDTKVVVVEYNSIFGSEIAVSVPEDERFDRTEKHYSWLYYGANLKAYVDLLESKGLVFVGTNRVRSNAFFVRKDLINRVSIEIPTSLSNFTENKIRESRDEFGRMNHLELTRGYELIKDQLVIDLEQQREVRLGSLGATSST